MYTHTHIISRGCPCCPQFCPALSLPVQSSLVQSSLVQSIALPPAVLCRALPGHPKLGLAYPTLPQPTLGQGRKGKGGEVLRAREGRGGEGRGGERRGEKMMAQGGFSKRVSPPCSAPTWSSRCCFFSRLISILANHQEGAQLESSAIRNEPNQK